MHVRVCRLRPLLGRVELGAQPYLWRAQRSFSSLSKSGMSLLLLPSTLLCFSGRFFLHLLLRVVFLAVVGRGGRSGKKRTAKGVRVV